MCNLPEVQSNPSSMDFHGKSRCTNTMNDVIGLPGHSKGSAPSSRWWTDSPEANLASRNHLSWSGVHRYVTYASLLDYTLIPSYSFCFFGIKFKIVGCTVPCIKRCACLQACPICGFPIRLLPYPPFKLQAAPNSDGKFPRIPNQKSTTFCQDASD